MVTLVLVVIYLILIIYVNVRYNVDEKCNKKYDIFRETDIGISPIEAAYLLDANANSLDLLLAGVLELSRKGYIDLRIEELNGKKDYVFSKTKKEFKASEFKKYEVSIYRLFFNDEFTNKVCLSQYLNKLNFNNKTIEELEVRMINIKEMIDQEFINKGIEDENSRKKIKQFEKIGRISFNTFLTITLVMLAFTFFSIMLYKKVIFFSLVGILMSILLIVNTTKRQRKITVYGDDLREKVKGIKNLLKDYSLIKERPIYTVKVLEEKYIWGVALGIADLGEKEFIKPVYLKKKTKFTIYALVETMIILILMIIVISNKEIMNFILLLLLIGSCFWGSREN